MIAVDHAGLEVLDIETCLELLTSVPIGRVAFVDAGDVAIFPVNHAREGRTIVFRTAGGSKLDAALRIARVTFEADRYDETTRTAWSVLLVGRADVVMEPDELARLEALDLEPWAPTERPHWVRIRPDEISGRRITR